MRTFVDWFARNPVAANLLMLALVFGGLVSALTIKMELFPSFSLDTITVSVVHPGASPEEIEEGVCIKIEEEVHSIEGVKRVTSTANEGAGMVRIELHAGVDARRVLDDVKTRVDAIESFPEDAESPVIEEALLRNQVVNVALHGHVPERTLKELGERVRDRINALDGISQVELAGARPYEVSIEVSELALERYGLTFDELTQAVRASSIDLSGGSIKSGRGEILLRTDAQAYAGADFEELVLRAQPDGSRVRVGDVATVVDGFADTDQSARFGGEPTVVVQVFRVGEENALDVAAAVRGFVRDFRAELPAGVSIDTWQDASRWLQGRLDLLVKNGLQGLFLVFAILALFLRFRLAVWVTLGIPISFLGALLVMPWFDQSINMLSLFAFILVLGIVVDDAIVVGESVHHEHERGNAGVAGAVRGVRSVAVPVVFAVLTTVAAFVPMIFLPGSIGKFFAVVPLAVIPALLFSLVESQLVLPAHLSHEGKLGDRLARVWPFKAWVLAQGVCVRGLRFVAERVYRPLLEAALAWRYVTVAIAVGALLVTGGAIASGRVQYVFFPDIEGDVVAAQLTMPQGTSARTTAAAIERIEEAARALVGELEAAGDRDVVRYVMASVGEQPYLAQQQMTQTGGARITGAQLGEVVLELYPAEQRKTTATALANRWRELCGPIAGAVDLRFSAAVMSAGKPIDFLLAGGDVDALRAAAADAKAELARYPGVFDVADSFRGGKEELVLDVLPEAEAAGITRRDLARQVRQGFYGEEAQRMQRGRDDVKVMVRYPEADRGSLYGVERMRVRGASGAAYPFSEVASVESRRGYATIARSDRARTVRVTADVDLTVANPNEILDEFEEQALPGILARHRGVSATREGQASDQREFISTMLRSYALALFAIYALMAIPLRSYVQPLIVMTAIPFGIVGAIWGHALLGLDLSSLSLLGIAALMGVVVNDSLVLVDYVNRHRDDGHSAAGAAHRAGLARFRPIVLTSLTTFAGLTPLILERSVQAQFLVPMAVALAFGVLLSTAVSLVLVPCGYLILDDAARAFRWLYGGRGELARTA